MKLFHESSGWKASWMTETAFPGCPLGFLRRSRLWVAITNAELFEPTECVRSCLSSTNQARKRLKWEDYELEIQTCLVVSIISCPLNPAGLRWLAENEYKSLLIDTHSFNGAIADTTPVWSLNMKAICSMIALLRSTFDWALCHSLHPQLATILSK